jgi:tetratricopeptide (TPR) repeat protein
MPHPPQDLPIPDELTLPQREKARGALESFAVAINALRQRNPTTFLESSQKAMQLFRQADWIPSEIIPLFNTYVSILYKHGHAELAFRECEDWLKRHPHSVQLRETVAKFYFIENRFDLAARHFETIAESYPNSLRTQRRLILVYSSLGAKEKALGAVDHSLKLIGFQPGRLPRIEADEDALLACLQVTHRFYDYKRLADIAPVVLLKRPDDTEALMALGIAERYLGRYDLAIEHLRDYLQVAPKDSANLHAVELHLAIALLKKNQTREAVEVLVPLLTTKPHSSKSYLHLGKALARLGNPQAAEAFLERSRSLAPIETAMRREKEQRSEGQIAPADRLLALSHRLAGNYAEAESVLRKALQFGNPGHRVYLIEHLVETVRANEALQEIKLLANELGADNSDVLGWTAAALVLQGEFEKGADVFETACQRSSEFLRTWSTHLIRVCLAELHDAPRARRVAESVLEFTSEPRAKIFLARAHFAEGNFEEARKILASTAPGTPDWQTEHGALWLARCRTRLGKELEEAGRDLDMLAASASHLPEYHQARAEWLEAYSSGDVPSPREKRPSPKEKRPSPNGDETSPLPARKRAAELDALQKKYRATRQKAARADAGTTRAQLLVETARILYKMGDRDGALREARLAAFAAPRETVAFAILEEWLDQPDEIFEQAHVQRELHALDASRPGAPSPAQIIERLIGISTEQVARDTAITGTATTGELASGSSLIESVQFLDVTATSGIDFHNVCGDNTTKDFIISANGAGVALLDYDLDGDLDIYFVNGSRLEPPHGAGAGSPPPSDALYRNDGELKFTDVTQQAGLTESDWGFGATVGDYDNDGDPDIFVANWGRDRLWKNLGNGTFEDATVAAGTIDPRWGSSCCFVDYDGDGFLDLFVANYLDFDPKAINRRGTDPSCRYRGQQVMCGPAGLPSTPCTLYRNRGDGTFEDVSDRSGIRAVDLTEATYALGVAIVDIDGDDKIDIYVANDGKPNLLFRNQGDGTFEEIGLISGLAVNDDGNAQGGMGVDAVFLGGKKLEDLFVVNYEIDTNTYHANEGGFFSERTTAMGLAAPCFEYLGWSTFFFDCNLDGDLDLFISQGHVLPQADQITASPGWAQPNKLFLNDGNGHFTDASVQAGPGLAIKKSSRGAAYGDLDGDGDADIVINEIDDTPTILENAGKPSHHWLAVRAVGSKSNRSGIGAVVTLELSGGKTLRQRIRSGSSYASSSELVARFGLGNATRVERLSVRWPTGVEEVFAVQGIDRMMEVAESE